MWTIDHALHKLSDHFVISGILTTRIGAQWNESPEITSCDRNWRRVRDFDTSGVGKWRRQCFGSESPKAGKSDRWQGSMSETEDSGEDRWRTCRQDGVKLR
jgi:hypothetical protein